MSTKVQHSDRRTECDVCGKYVWPVTHSCKGVPATPAAWDRRDARKGHQVHADERPGTPNNADSDRIWHCHRCGYWWPINTQPERGCS